VKNHPLHVAKKMFYEETGARDGAWSLLSYDDRYEWIVKAEGGVHPGREAHYVPKERAERIKPADIEKMQSLLLQGKSRQQIADIMGVVVSTVRVHTKGIKARCSFLEEKAERDAEILKLKEKGVSVGEIAKKYGVTTQAIYKVFERLKKRTYSGGCNVR